MKFSLPYFYMKSEPFWSLIPKTSVDINNQTRNALELFSNLNQAIDYALIDEELYFFLSHKESRDLLKLTLIQRYFPDCNMNNIKGSNYVSDITHDILEENPSDYKEKLTMMQQRLEVDEYTEEVFLRGGIFKRVVPQIYNDTCCITGLNISATFAVSMVDACHIIPFSESHDDTITNGIALSPNMHRAFDRGLITIGTDYKVKVSDRFIEEAPSPYSIKQFAGKRILLPKDERYFPSRENLEWHGREKLF
jgi:putative restriction endonuclease